MWATPPTNALSNEADIAKVQEWLSHASISTTPSRLQVKIAVDPAVAMQQIPSLMLQPIVENALKHGLGPKPGPGHLWITAEADGNQVRLRVEDDGVGTAIGVLKLNSSNGRSSPNAYAACCFRCSASKRTPFFQTSKVVAPILRAKVRRAKCGFTPRATQA